MSIQADPADGVAVKDVLAAVANALVFERIDHAQSAMRPALLDVRLAIGVRKALVYAVTGRGRGIEWLFVARLTA